MIRYVAAPLAIAAIFALSATGCGSGGDSSREHLGATAAEPATATAEMAGDGRRESRNGTHASSRRSGKATSQHGGKKQNHKTNAGEETTTGNPAEQPGAEQPQGDQTVVGVSGRCPSAISRAECKVVAKQVAKHQPSYTVETPGECVEALGRAQCEALFASQKSAQDSAGESYELEQCREHPTPACEAAFTPVLEAQYQASQASK